jgi:hypothetical protein
MTTLMPHTTQAGVPQAVRSTMEIFEMMIRDDERREKELRMELAVLAARERVIGASQDVGWLRTRFIAPREEELLTLETRLATVRGKLQRLRAEWAKKQPAPLMVWQTADERDEISLVA